MRPLLLERLTKMIKNYAIILNDANVQPVINAAQNRLKLNLDYLPDTMEFNAFDGEETVVFVSVNEEPREVKVDEMTRSEFEKKYELRKGFNFVGIFEPVVKL